MTITQYIDSLNQRYQLGNATERAFRGDLQSLVNPSLPLKPPSMRSRTPKLRLTTLNLTSTALRLTSKTLNDRNKTGKVYIYETYYFHDVSEFA